MIETTREIKEICDICGRTRRLKEFTDGRLCTLHLPSKDNFGEYTSCKVEVCDQCLEEVAKELKNYYDSVYERYGGKHINERGKWYMPEILRRYKEGIVNDDQTNI